MTRRMLITGASSSLALGVIRQLLLKGDAEIWCCRHRSEIQVSHPRLHTIDIDFASDFAPTLAGLEFDTVIHFAGLTHSSDEHLYWKINLEATTRLAHVVNKNGCRHFVFISTRCATAGAGAYGESKLAAEQELQKLDWQSLLIIRPAEVYGSDTTEGIDRMLGMARKWRIVPALFGNRNLMFAPLHIDDFHRIVSDSILLQAQGVSIQNLCGPEDLTGIQVASRISRSCGALPLPVWWPITAFCLRALQRIGVSIVKMDQLTRLTAVKTATARDTRANTKGFKRFLQD